MRPRDTDRLGAGMRLSAGYALAEAFLLFRVVFSISEFALPQLLLACLLPQLGVLADDVLSACTTILPRENSCASRETRGLHPLAALQHRPVAGWDLFI